MALGILASGGPGAVAARRARRRACRDRRRGLRRARRAGAGSAAGPGRRSGRASCGRPPSPGRWPSPRRPGSGATSASSPLSRSSSGSPTSRSRWRSRSGSGRSRPHTWAARLTDAVPETTLPLVTAIAPAALAIVALAWADASIAPLPLDLTLGPVRRPRRRHRLDLPRLGRGADPGRHRAHRRVRDRRRCRGRDARGRRTRPRGVGTGPDLDPGVRRRPAARSPRGRRRHGPPSGPVASLIFAAGPSARRSSRSCSASSSSASIGLPGLAAAEARGTARSRSCSTARSRALVMLGTLEPAPLLRAAVRIGIARTAGTQRVPAGVRSSIGSTSPISASRSRRAWADNRIVTRDRRGGAAGAARPGRLGRGVRGAQAAAGLPPVDR